MVIAILASLLLPALSRAKAKAQSIKCVNNLRQLTLCWLMYPDDNGDRWAPQNPGTTAADVTHRVECTRENTAIVIARGGVKI